MLKNIVNNIKSVANSVTNSGAATPERKPSTTSTVNKTNLFEPIPPECDHDCDSCTIKLPAKWEIEEKEDLWNSTDGWSTHVVIATGATDWIRDVSEEKGSMMEALGGEKPLAAPTNGKLKVSASNMPLPDAYFKDESRPTTVLLLPAFTIIQEVAPKDTVELVEKFINVAPTTTTPMNQGTSNGISSSDQSDSDVDLAAHVTKELVEEGIIKADSTSTAGPSPDVKGASDGVEVTTVTAEKPVDTPRPPPPTAAFSTLDINSNASSPSPTSSYLKSMPCPHDYIVLLCSHKKRDARCGQSAPLLHKELRRHLQPLGLYRDFDDSRSGGVGIYFINHVGGHKWSANMIIYRKQAGQGIWLARVAPKDIEKIVKWTVLEGKVTQDMIRAGFDRSKGLVSW